MRGYGWSGRPRMSLRSSGLRLLRINIILRVLGRFVEIIKRVARRSVKCSRSRTAIITEHIEVGTTMHSQRYVSNELTHFVGKGKTEDEQYDILVNKVLRAGWLTYPPHDHARPRSLALDLSQAISADKSLKYEVVCFCDIPESDLAIHVSKYSKFGLAFKKEFLIAKGACPVFYVANESPVPATEVFAPGDFLDRINAACTRGLVDRALYFDTSVRGLLDIFVALDALCCDESKRYVRGGGLPEPESLKRFGQLLGLSDAQIEATKSALRDNEQATKTIRMCADFLMNYVFSFIKCFDASRTFDDEANYYMEREWRVANDVSFNIDDVSRVFLPAAYARRFRVDLPAYVGQISFVD